MPITVFQLSPAFRLHILALFRIALGFLFACHGAASIFGILGGAQNTGGSLPIGQWPGWWAAVIQLVGGILVMLGLFTQPAALLSSGSMAYAYFTVHQEISLLPIQNHGEAAAQFALAFLVVAVVGPGAWALDNRWQATTLPSANPVTTRDAETRGAEASYSRRPPARRPGTRHGEGV